MTGDKFASYVNRRYPKVTMVRKVRLAVSHLDSTLKLMMKAHWLKVGGFRPLNITCKPWLSRSKFQSSLSHPESLMSAVITAHGKMDIPMAAFMAVIIVQLKVKTDFIIWELTKFKS